MKLQCGRKEFEVTDKDWVMYNGEIYQLMSQTYQDGFYKFHPTVAKGKVLKLIKQGKLVLSEKKYKGHSNILYDVYEFKC